MTRIWQMSKEKKVSPNLVRNLEWYYIVVLLWPIWSTGSKYNNNMLYFFLSSALAATKIIKTHTHTHRYNLKVALTWASFFHFQW